MNNEIFYFLYGFSYQSPAVDFAAVFFADIFPYIVVMAAGMFLLFHHEVIRAESPLQVLLEKKREVITVFLSGFFAYLISEVLKNLFHTVRPFVLLSEFPFLFSQGGYAFPSGHAAFFSALAFSIFFLHRKAGIVFMFFALIIGIARIVVGVHFRIDILGGFVLGAFVAYLMKKV